MIVGAQEIERRIEQARLLQADEHRVGAVLGAQAADADSRVRGRPDSSSRSGMPISGRKRPPRSKMRRILPGCVTSKRGSGSRNGTTPLRATSYCISGLRRASRPFASAAARPSCCSFRHSAAACSARAPLLYRAAPHSMQPCVIMPFFTSSTFQSGHVLRSSSCSGAGLPGGGPRGPPAPWRKHHPDVPIWTAAVDRELDENAYIRPAWATRATASSAPRALGR